MSTSLEQNSGMSAPPFEMRQSVWKAPMRPTAPGVLILLDMYSSAESSEFLFISVECVSPQMWFWSQMYPMISRLDRRTSSRVMP